MFSLNFFSIWGREFGNNMEEKKSHVCLEWSGLWNPAPDIAAEIFVQQNVHTITTTTKKKSSLFLVIWKDCELFEMFTSAAAPPGRIFILNSVKCILRSV